MNFLKRLKNDLDAQLNKAEADRKAAEEAAVAARREAWREEAAERDRAQREEERCKLAERRASYQGLENRIALGDAVELYQVYIHPINLLILPAHVYQVHVSQKRYLQYIFQFFHLHKLLLLLLLLL